MKKYLSFFRLRFSIGLQYRSAAIGGIITQFIWGVLEVLVYRAFYKVDPSAFPMTIQATASYTWLKEAFLALFLAWFMDNDIFNSIENGNIAYELCRPINIYSMWFSKSLANRVSSALLRSIPILLVALFIPKPYGLALPKSPLTFLLFLITMILGLLVLVSFCMLIYMISFFTISPMGIRMILVAIVEFFAGSVIPLPFFPDNIRKWMEFLPFAAMQNVPFRIYSLDISGNAIIVNILIQLFWLILLVSIGRILNSIAMKKIVVQGG